MKRELCPVRVVMTDQGRAGIHLAARYLAARGMAVCYVDSESGVLAGYCAPSAAPTLNEVVGVLSVETKGGKALQRAEG